MVGAYTLCAWLAGERDSDEPEEPSDDALVGAMLLWEGVDILRWLKRALQRL